MLLLVWAGQELNVGSFNRVYVSVERKIEIPFEPGPLLSPSEVRYCPSTVSRVESWSDYLKIRRFLRRGFTRIFPGHNSNPDTQLWHRMDHPQSWQTESFGFPASLMTAAASALDDTHHTHHGSNHSGLDGPLTLLSHPPPIVFATDPIPPLSAMTVDKTVKKEPGG